MFCRYVLQILHGHFSSFHFLIPLLMFSRGDTFLISLGIKTTTVRNRFGSESHSFFARRIKSLLRLTSKISFIMGGDKPCRNLKISFAKHSKFFYIYSFLICHFNYILKRLPMIIINYYLIIIIYL